MRTRPIIAAILLMYASAQGIAQDSIQVKLPEIYFAKNSSVLTPMAKKQLDSVIAIARRYPSKLLSVVMFFDLENEDLNNLIFDRGDKVFDYLEKKKIKNKLTSGTKVAGMDPHSIRFELIDKVEPADDNDPYFPVP